MLIFDIFEPWLLYYEGTQRLLKYRCKTWQGVRIEYHYHVSKVHYIHSPVHRPSFSLMF